MQHGYKCCISQIRGREDWLRHVFNDIGIWNFTTDERHFIYPLLLPSPKGAGAGAGAGTGEGEGEGEGESIYVEGGWKEG
jgi:hypothetical protein